MTIDKNVKIVVAQVMGVPEESIHGDSSPDTISSWDSLAHMNLVLALEQSFDVTFSEEHIAEMMSIEIIIATLKELS